MLNSILKTLSSGSSRHLRYCSAIATEASKQPIILPVNTDIVKPKFIQPRQAWIENLDTIQSQKVGLMELHPNVFAGMPRIDIIHENFMWQSKYGYINYNKSYNRAELPGSGKKPWPQKGLGKARHGSRRSPLFKGGGRAHGPRGPTPHFYMLDFFKRVTGLVATLSIKLAQDDMKIVRDLELPTDDPKYLLQLIDERLWGPSVLIVDDDDYCPRNIAAAAGEIPQVHIVPVYGLNVYSMLKYHTVVLTVPAVQNIERKLLFHMNRMDGKEVMKRFRVDAN